MSISTRIFVLVFVFFLTISAVCAAQTLTCKKCRQTITGAYFETNGDYYHPHCFVCDHCKEPIKGEYTVYRDHKYHDRCFKDNVALRCAVCEAVIQGEYLIDFWGNAYHLRHKKDTKSCEYCSRYISEVTTRGGVKYSDGRVICNICRGSAVTARNDAEAIMREVARHLSQIGIDVDLGAVNLHIVGLQEMQKKSEKGSYRLTGFTDFEEKKHLFGVSKERRIDVYLLYGMPRQDAVSTLAHELTHVWQFMAGRLKNDRALSEGSCNYAAYLVLRNYDDEQTRYVVNNIVNDENEVYGEGFRRVKRFVEKNGLAAWLDLLREKDRLPKSY